MKKTGYQIEELDFLNSEHEFNTLELLRHSFNENFTSKWWEWKYIQTPFGAPVGWFIRDFKSNIFIGVRILWPWEFTQTTKRVVYQPVDTATHPEFQGRGIFKLLINAAIQYVDMKKGVFFNFPNKNSAPIYLKYGWKSLGSVKWFLGMSFPFRNTRKFRSGIIGESCFNFSSWNLEKNDRMVKTLWNEERFLWRFGSHPTTRYFYYQNALGTVVYKIVFRKGVKTASIITTDFITQEFLRSFLGFLFFEGILFFSYNGYNSKLKFELDNYGLKIIRKRKVNYYIRNFDLGTNISFCSDLADSDFF